MIPILQIEKLRLKRVRVETQAFLTLKFISFFSLLNCLIYRIASSGTKIQILAQERKKKKSWLYPLRAV